MLLPHIISGDFDSIVPETLDFFRQKVWVFTFIISQLYIKELTIVVFWCCYISYFCESWNFNVSHLMHVLHFNIHRDTFNNSTPSIDPCIIRMNFYYLKFLNNWNGKYKYIRIFL